jgi:cold-inducible RNA-binding protein
MPAKLYVGGLSYSTTSESLREYFAQCGTVESATVITDRFSGQSRGFGFVEMATDAEAQTAIQKLNDQAFEGRRITVQAANSSGQRSGGGGGGGRSGGGGGFRSGGGGGGGGFGGGGGGQRRTPRW